MDKRSNNRVMSAAWLGRGVAIAAVIGSTMAARRRGLLTPAAFAAFVKEQTP